MQNTVPAAAIAPNTKYTVLGLRASPIEGMKRTTRKERLQLKHAQKELAKALNEKEVITSLFLYDILTLASIGINSTFKSHANGPRPIMKKNTNTIKPTNGTHPMSATVCSETFKDASVREPLGDGVEWARRVG